MKPVSVRSRGTCARVCVLMSQCLVMFRVTSPLYLVEGQGVQVNLGFAAEVGV